MNEVSRNDEEEYRYSSNDPVQLKELLTKVVEVIGGNLFLTETPTTNTVVTEPGTSFIVVGFWPAKLLSGLIFLNGKIYK